MSRYSRQELFQPIGKDGQQKIRDSFVAIVGCGALGSLQAEVLTRAGIGKLILIDRDFVEFSNLQRQSLFEENDAERVVPKAQAAAEHLKRLNSEVEITPHVADLSVDTLQLLNSAQLILDGSDNFQVRLLLNDYCWQKNIPWIYGACVGSSGTAAPFLPPSFPCLRCVFEGEPPPGSAPTCDTAGILWPAVGAVVSYQITAALKILTGNEITPEIMQMDLWNGEHRMISLKKAKRQDCPTCGLHQYPSLGQQTIQETALCGRDAVQIRPPTPHALDLDIIFKRWQSLGITKRNPFLVKLVLPDNEIVLFPDGRAIIKGTSDFIRARDLYAKYVGN
ncbi:MAG TPA: ThiF family adenylyltransferase [Acidobacteriota bacterium]|nr:ThiF family adenylyltransferase [Acidobacteriota bacterium]